MSILMWRKERTSLRVLLVLVSLVTGGRSVADGLPKRERPLVLVHYMPWFEAKPALRQWGWHWTMNAFDPEKSTEGKRNVASYYYPLIGPYDSGDPAVMEYHLLLMKLAGIDGVIVDWYGLSDLYDYPVVHRNTCALFAYAATLGLKVAICYEDQTIPTLISQKRLAATDRVSHAERELAWIQENWFSQAAYLKRNGKPVFLSFGYAGLTDGEWGQVLRSTPSPPLYLSEHRRRMGANGSFDWPQPQTGLASLDTYYQAPKEDSVFVPVAFPRFHDIYKQAKVHDSFGEISDADGRTFAATLERALKSGAPFVQIATWNDWGEGTGIEPTKEFGYRDLETVVRLHRPAGAPIGRSTDALRLPYRLWVLRGRQGGTSSQQADLDRVAAMLASGKTADARSALTRLESRPGGKR